MRRLLRRPPRRPTAPSVVFVAGLAATANGLMAALVPGPVAAQIEPGRVYSGGEQVSDPSLGLTLTLPIGWKGVLAPNGAAFVMESDVGGGYMFVTGDRMTEADARAQLSGPVDLGDGIVLTPSGEVREISTGHLSGRFAVRGAPSELESIVDVRLTADGLGVAFILLTPPSMADEHTESMRELALSLGVQETTAQVAAGNDEWEPYLRGRYLARYYTTSGYTESTEIWLCSDGTFYFNDQAGGFGGGASGAFQTLDRGRWSASGAGAAGTLVLEWTSGERSRWSLEYDYEQDHLYMNGDRWLRGDNERCSQ